MDRGAWRAAVHGVSKSQTRLRSNFLFSSVLFLLCVWAERARPQSCQPLLFSGHSMRPSQLENALLQPAHLEAHRLLEALSDARWWALVLGVGLAPLSNFTSFLSTSFPT